MFFLKKWILWNIYNHRTFFILKHCEICTYNSIWGAVIGGLEDCEQQTWSTSTLVRQEKFKPEMMGKPQLRWMCNWIFSAQRKQAALCFLRSSSRLCIFAAKWNTVLQAATSVVVKTRNSHSGRIKMELCWLKKANWEHSACKVCYLWKTQFESSMIY